MHVCMYEKWVHAGNLERDYANMCHKIMVCYYIKHKYINHYMHTIFHWLGTTTLIVTALT